MSDYSLVAASRNEKRIRDLTRLIRKVSWTTQRQGAPGRLEFDLLKGENASFAEGDQVLFSLGGKNCFQGYIFAKKKTEKGEIHTLCYDQLRYLRARQSYVFSGYTLGAVVKKIAADFGLKTGAIADSKYVIPSLLVDDQTCLDTIWQAAEMTAAGGAGAFLFFDDIGRLSLKSAADMRLDLVLGDESLASSYSYLTSIDDEVYNYVKLLKPDAAAGRGETYVAKSDETIARWGFLQLYQRVNEDSNDAQMREQAKNLLSAHNRLKRTLRLEAMGVPGVRAGHSIRVEIAQLGDIALSDWLVADRVTHTVDPYRHNMALEFVFSTAADGRFAISYDKGSEAIAQKIPAKTGSTGSSSAPAGGGGYLYPHRQGYRISCPYGRKGSAWAVGWHSGADFVGTGSKKIYAIAAGRVTKAGWDGSYGKSIRILHDDGYLSLYGHLSEIRAAVGKRVDKNTVIGVEGSTGNASGSHLHLEIHKGSYRYPSSIDPVSHIKSRLKR